MSFKWFGFQKEKNTTTKLLNKVFDMIYLDDGTLRTYASTQFGKKILNYKQM